LVDGSSPSGPTSFFSGYFPGEGVTLRRFVSLVQVLVLGSGALVAQTSQAADIRQQVDKIGLQGNITVYMPNGQEYYGSVSRIGAEDFSVDEVDQRREVPLRYSEVKKVRSGYGTGRAINGKRIHPRKRLWIMVAVVGGLLTLVFVAVATDKS
jgi:hypothetical protein